MVSGLHSGSERRECIFHRRQQQVRRKRIDIELFFVHDARHRVDKLFNWGMEGDEDWSPLRFEEMGSSPRETAVTFQIDHLGIAVKSLAAAKTIYEKLGLDVSPEEIVEHEQVRLVMIPVGESRLELLEATSEDSTIAKFIAKRGEGLHHICLKVPNLAAAVARLKNDGVRLVSEEIKSGAGGHQYVFVHPSSTGGVLLELVEG
jgi:methylmalonyl-CoA/ethylmalonyl-CoA epimerase